MRVRPIRGRPWAVLSAALVFVAIAVIIVARDAYPIAVVALALSTMSNLIDHRTSARRSRNDLRSEHPPQ